MTTSPKILKFSNRDEAVATIADTLQDAANHAIKKNGFANIALSGGSTPEPAYNAFAQRPLEWEKINILLVDERWVAIDDEASNEKMIRRAFEPADGINFIGMKNEFCNAFNAAPRVEGVYSRFLPPSVVVLGMGDDGHTASWFADAPNINDLLDVDYHHKVAATNASKSWVGGKYPIRMTLTLAPIIECENVILLIFGDTKLKVLENIMNNNDAANGYKSGAIGAVIDGAKNGLKVFWAQ